MKAAYSTYVPCFNNVATVRRTVASVFAQTSASGAVFVIDDCSTDDSLATLSGLPVQIIRQNLNTGRGAVRARAMQECGADIVLCVDATNVIPPDFVARAMPWFEDARVGAVYGRISQPARGDASHRWRGRHLFKIPPAGTPAGPARHYASLATYAALVRRDAVLEVGGFDASLRHSEDAELGRRLLAAGWDVVCDPSLETLSLSHNTAAETLERYWRWHAGEDQAVTWRGYRKNIGYSLKVMVAADLRQRDPLAALLSLACPHYQFWRSRLGSKPSPKSDRL